jgi:exonuclease III
MNRRLTKGHHIDYAFLSQVLIQDATVGIGLPDLWLGYSDHVPLILETQGKTVA